MKTLLSGALATTMVFSTACGQADKTTTAKGEEIKLNAELLSLRNEMKLAIRRGNAFLKTKQSADGYWGDKKIPAFTAFAISAAMGDPDREGTPDHIQKGYKWLVAQQKFDGGIYVKGLSTYNTSIGMMALLAAGDKYEKEIVKARAHLVGLQHKKDPNALDAVMNGGIGYGGSYPHSDMSNTHLALHAIKASQPIVKDGKHGKQPELDWEAALDFVSSCQNLKTTNKNPQAGNDGSFVYFPGNSKAGFTENKDGTKTLRGYGSMSYAGLLSLIHADLDDSDPRVKTVTNWLSENYSLEENPGLGLQGLFYYYNVMAKSLAAANIDTLTTSEGKKINWRKELSSKILQMQNKDGSWVNENSRWMESDAVLVTAYAVLTLEQIHRSIPATK